VVVCVAALIEVAEVFIWIKFLRRYRVQTGAEGLVGKRGQVIGPGRIRVHGEIWTASGASPLEPGDQVRVAAVDGLTLRVEPESE
jgi:membrane-bound serine protease (ClpP class)